MANYPTVAIVGRTNVGKSTLFNRLTPRVKSITLDQEGVTRDTIKDLVTWKDSCFQLVDTGGVNLRATNDPIFEQVRARALAVVEKADVVLFVCDGKVGILPEDHAIAKILHKLGKYIILIVNKIDSHQAQENLYEFDRLGMDVVVPVSIILCGSVVARIKTTERGGSSKILSNALNEALLNMCASSIR